MELLSLSASIASLVLAVVAIWISFHQKRETDKTHIQTLDLLTQIKSDAKVITSVALPELKAYGDLSRKLMENQFKISGTVEHKS